MKKTVCALFIIFIACASSTRIEDEYILSIQSKIPGLSVADQQIVQRIHLTLGRGNLQELRDEAKQHNYEKIQERSQREFWGGVLAIAIMHKRCSTCADWRACAGVAGFTDPKTPEHDAYLICDRYLLHSYPNLYDCTPK